MIDGGFGCILIQHDIKYIYVHSWIPRMTNGYLTQRVAVDVSNINL